MLRLTGVTVDLSRGLATRRGAVVALTPLEARLLAYLREDGGVVDRARLLEQVWGYRRGLASRTVDTTMRRLREKVELDPEAPRHLLTIHGQGYRFVGAPALPAAGPLIGRGRELEALLEALGRARVVTVYGHEGQGRATLARHAALRWGPAAELPGTDDLCALDAALSRALGLRGGEARALRRLERVGEHLLLLRADAPDERRALASWLPERAVGGLRAIVVSEAPLGLPGEIALPLGGLEREDAVALLRARLGPAPSEGSLRRLAEAWDGWPLALQYEAQRLATGLPTGAPDRTLDAVLARSWGSISGEARGDLARLAVGDGLTGARDEILPWLSRADGRPTLPPAVARWIVAQPEGQRALDLRGATILAAIEADPDGSWDEDAAALARGAAAAPLRAAAALALAERALTTGAEAQRWLDILRALGASPPRLRLIEARAHQLVGACAPAAAQLRELSEDPQVDPSLRAEARAELALVRLAQRDLPGAEAALSDPWPTPHSRLLAARARAAIAQMTTAPDAVAQWRAVLDEAERQGRRRLLARWSTNLGIMLRVANREPEAERVLQRAIALQAELGDVHSEVYARVCLAQARYDRGDLGAAAAQLDLAETLLAHRDQPRDQQYILALRGAMALEQGDPIAARSLCEEALTISPVGFAPAAVRGLLGSAHWLAGDLPAAERELREAVAALEAGPAPERVRQATVARWLAVRAERGERAPPSDWPCGGSADAVAAAVDVERLHLTLAGPDLDALRAGWRGLRPPRSGADRVARVLLRARLRRMGLNPDEIL